MVPLLQCVVGGPPGARGRGRGRGGPPGGPGMGRGLPPGSPSGASPGDSKPETPTTPGLYFISFVSVCFLQGVFCAGYLVVRLENVGVLDFQKKKAKTEFYKTKWLMPNPVIKTKPFLVLSYFVLSSKGDLWNNIKPFLVSLLTN